MEPHEALNNLRQLLVELIKWLIDYFLSGGINIYLFIFL